MALQGLTQYIQIAQIIRFGIKAGIAIVPALDNMLGHTRQMESWLSGHGTPPVCHQPAVTITSNHQMMTTTSISKNRDLTPVLFMTPVLFKPAVTTTSNHQMMTTTSISKNRDLTPVLLFLF
jgi:hypothetical protein